MRKYRVEVLVKTTVDVKAGNGDAARREARRMVEEQIEMSDAFGAAWTQYVSLAEPLTEADTKTSQEG